MARFIGDEMQLKSTPKGLFWVPTGRKVEVDPEQSRISHAYSSIHGHSLDVVHNNAGFSGRVRVKQIPSDVFLHAR